MASTLWRRIFLGVYVVSMVLVSLLLVLLAFDDGEMVQIDDQAEVMRRRTPSILASVTLEVPCWPPVEITDQDYLYRLSRRISVIPRVSGSFPGEAPGKLAGRMVFADGGEEPFSLSNTLMVGEEVYYSPEAREELAELRRSLAGWLYTLQSLATFFVPDNQVVVEDTEGSVLLSPQDTGLLRQAIEAGELVEDPEEANQAVRDRPPRYAIHVRTGAGVDMLRLLVYGNESIQVYDTYSSGQPLLLCFGGELVPLCQGLLEAA